MLREIYGIVFKKHRTEQLLTLRQLSRRSGVSISYLSDIEHGRKDPSSEMLEDICGALGLDILDLLEMAVQELLAEPKEEEAA